MVEKERDDFRSTLIIRFSSNMNKWKVSGIEWKCMISSESMLISLLVVLFWDREIIRNFFFYQVMTGIASAGVIATLALLSVDFLARYCNILGSEFSYHGMAMPVYMYSLSIPF